MNQPVSIASIIPGLLQQQELTKNAPAPVEGKKELVYAEKTSTTPSDSPLTFVSANFERMPIYFLCSSDERAALETTARQNNTPILLVKNNKGEKLSISPSGSYGLPTGFDMDVMTVIHYKIHEAFQLLDECPSTLRLWLSEFPQLMKHSKSGQLYENIRESVRRLSEVTIYHENFLRYPPDKDGNVFIPDRTIKLFQFIGSAKIPDLENKEPGYSPVFIDIQLTDWHRASINAQTFTSFDIDLYFSLPTERAKRLYRFLEYIRYSHEAEIPYTKLLEELHIDPSLPSYRRSLKRALDPLVKAKFLRSYTLEDKAVVSFAEKKSVPPRLPTITVEQQGAVLRLMEATGDKNRKWAEYIIRTTPWNIVDRIMGETKEAIREGRILKNPSAFFTYHRKRMLHSDSTGHSK